MSPINISVLQSGEHPHIGPLLDVLKRMYPARWNVCRDLSAIGDEDAVIALDADVKWLGALVARKKSALVFSDPAQWSQAREIRRFDVEQSAEAPAGLSGASMGGVEKTRVGNWDQGFCAQVVARDATGPVWLRLRRDGARVDVANVSFNDTVPYGVFSPAMWGEQMLQWIILIDFMREITGDSEWTNPAPVASVIFDDPNLHGMRYGHLDYLELLESMRRNHYHVAVATIPIDTWYVSKPVAAFFREHTREYSFLYHGNDHVSNELARDYTQMQRTGLVAQALRRIARFEARARIGVEKIMVAPHGACGDGMLRELAIQDFQGACISWGSLNHHNREQGWARELGLKNTEIIHELPVLSRTSFEGVDEKSVRLALFLRQPIILRGHHGDLKEGLGALEEKIDMVNQIAHPRWSSIGRILKSNFRTRLQKGCLEVRPYARSVEVEIPPGCSTVAVAGVENGFGTWDDTLGKWICGEIQGNAQGKAVREGPCGRMIIDRRNLSEQNPDGVSKPWPALWPVTRRFLTETRDRMAPYLRR